VGHKYVFALEDIYVNNADGLSIAEILEHDIYILMIYAK